MSGVISRTSAVFLAIAISTIGFDSGAAPLVSDGTLSVCTDATYPPLEFFEKAGDEHPVGFDIDIATAVAKELGASARILNVPFTGLLPALGSGRCTVVISALTITPERTEKFAAVPYMQYQAVMMVTTDARINDAADLEGKVIAYQSGSAVFEAAAARLNNELQARGKTPIAIQKYPGGTDLVQQLITGRVQGVITFDNNVAWQAIVNPGKFTTGFGLSEMFVSGIYLQKDSENIVVLTKAINALKESGDYQMITKKWQMPQSVGDFD